MQAQEEPRYAPEDPDEPTTVDPVEEATVEMSGIGAVRMIALFDRTGMAQSCAEALERQFPQAEYGVMVRRDASGQEDQMSNSTAVGATVGATAGLLAASYLLPPLGAATSSLVTTLMGAGLGSVLGGLAGDQVGGDGQNLLLIQANAQDADEIQRLIHSFNPRKVWVQ